jgi:predicted NAD/FAD-dependent oxidoreductase
MDQEDSQWKVIAEDGSHEFFDAVVLTIPPPMALSLQGTVAERIAPLRPTFDSLQYSTRYAVAAFYGDEGWDALDSAGGAWCSKYVDHDDVLRYVSVETRKRLGGQATPMERQHGGPALLLHSTVPFGLRASPSEALASMMASLPRVVPTLESVEPKHTQLTHWMLSQVRAPLEGGPFLDVPPLSGSGPTLLLAGDAYTGSHFEGCICSAHAAASHLAALQCS